MQACSEPAEQRGYVNPPIVRASTVVYDDVGTMKVSQADPLRRSLPAYGRGTTYALVSAPTRRKRCPVLRRLNRGQAPVNAHAVSDLDFHHLAGRHLQPAHVLIRIETDRGRGWACWLRIRRGALALSACNSLTADDGAWCAVTKEFERPSSYGVKIRNTVTTRRLVIHMSRKLRRSARRPVAGPGPARARGGRP